MRAALTFVVHVQGFVEGAPGTQGSFPRSAVEIISSQPTTPATAPDLDEDALLDAQPVRRRVYSIASAESIVAIEVPAAERMIVNGKLTSMYQIDVATNRRQATMNRRCVNVTRLFFRRGCCMHPPPHQCIAFHCWCP